jgi:DNA-directed RNA polymerase specialized sigma24 family protein
MTDHACLDGTGTLATGLGAADEMLAPLPLPSFVPSAETMRQAEEGPYILGSDPDLWLYRERTRALLRRYQRLSVEVGRLPSLLGREIFHSRVTSYRAGTFEDAVIFVHDVARGLARLAWFDHQLISKIVLQDYTHNETARLLGCWRRTVGRRFPEALDQLTDIFLETGLLARLPAADVARAKICQEGGMEENVVSDSAQCE